MKNILFILVFFLCFISCEKEKIDEVPENVSYLKPFPDLVDSLQAYFPECRNNFDAYPNLFVEGCQKNIELVKESEIYITFMDETAGSTNSLFWYSYNKNLPSPVNVSEVQGNLLFPNISKIGEGGQLESGHTLQLGTGKFPAGTVIGFYLITDGWKDGVIDYAQRTIYTDYCLNKGGKQQHILFKDSFFKYVLMGFEDMDFENAENDKDYNDIIFSVTDNAEGIEATAIDLSNVLIK